MEMARIFHLARTEIEEKGNVETKSLVEYFSSLSYNTKHSSEVR